MGLFLQPQRQKYLLYTPPYADNPNAILSKKENPYPSIQSLFGKTVAIPKGFFTEEILRKNYPQIHLLPVKNMLETMKAVSFGKADAALGELAVFNYLLTEHMMSDLSISGEAMMGDPEFSLLNIATRKELPELHSILTKGVESITIEEKKELQRKWLGTKEENTIDLTQDEKAFLASKQEIKMCVNPNAMPYEEINPDSKHVGLAADYIQLIAKILNLNIVLYPTESWKETLDSAKNRLCDIISLAKETEEREAYLDFTHLTYNTLLSLLPRPTNSLLMILPRNAIKHLHQSGDTLSMTY